ncbi:MAG TPA: type II secretion system protein [Patescibacteria group bacterium]|nr:type II secretion system protein [Patescibacteria group bacterium]
MYRSYYEEKNISGFTLVELLIVIGIISFLIIALFININVSTIRMRARDAKRINDLRKISTALEEYFHTYGQYPPDYFCDTSRGDSTGPSCNPTGVTWAPSGLAKIKPSFILTLPLDPLNNSEYYYTYEPVVNEINYNVTSTNSIVNAYMLSARLEDVTNPNARPGCDQCFPDHNYCVAGGGAEFFKPCTL